MRTTYFLLLGLLPVFVTAAACGSSPTDSSSGSSSGSTPIQAAATGPVDPSAAAKAAALLGSCIPDDRSNRMLQRIYERAGTDVLDGFERMSVACLATKTNGCQGVTECTGIAVDIVADCKQGCDGNVATSCDDEMRFRTDCGKWGLQCVTDADGDPECLPGPPEPCDFSSYAATCQDGRPTYCTGARVLTGPRCADYGTECRDVSSDVPGDFSYFACVGTAGACEAKSNSASAVDYDQGLSCEGNMLHACVNGGVAVVDCTKLGVGFSCQSAGDAFFCGLANECVPGETKPSCEGDALVLCNAGRVERVDCTSLGFTGCLASVGACVPSPWGN